MLNITPSSNSRTAWRRWLIAATLPLLVGLVLWLWLRPVVGLGDASVASQNPWSPAREIEESVATNIAQNPDAQVAFLGDSITQLWSREGSSLWDQHFAETSVNLGVAGDQTQHILYRLDNGLLDSLRPEVIVLHIGTNNSPHHTGDQIVAGIDAVVDELRRQVPTARIIVFNVFPRIDDPTALERIEHVRSTLADSITDDNTTVVDAAAFWSPSGKPRPELLDPDGVHLSKLGYEVWLASLVESL